MGKDVIVALDFDSKEKTLAFLDLSLIHISEPTRRS